jgi:hypothetical protein
LVKAQAGSKNYHSYLKIYRQGDAEVQLILEIQYDKQVRLIRGKPCDDATTDKSKLARCKNRSDFRKDNQVVTKEDVMTHHRFVFVRWFLILVFVFVWSPTLSRTQTINQQHELDKQRTIEFANLNIKTALRTLINQVKLDIEFDDSVKDSRFTLERKEITIREYLNIVLEEEKLVAKLKDDHTILIFADTPENRSKYEGLKSWPEKPPK